MNATLREIVLAVRFGDASLVGESVGYLILGACDRVVAVPRSVDLDGVLVTGDGEVVLDAHPASEEQAERSLRFLLGQLLTLVRSPFPNLARGATRDVCGLGHLVTELEAALVPVNRRAARRSLSRLVREARRSLAKDHPALAVTAIDPLPEPVTQPVAARATAPEVAPTLLDLTPSSQAAPVYAVTLSPEAPDARAWPTEVPSPGASDAPDVFEEVPSLLFEPVTEVPSAAVSPAPDTAELGPEDAFDSDLESAPSTLGEAPIQSGEVSIWGAEAESDAPLEAAIDEAVDLAFDNALTRVASAVETLPPPEARPVSSFNLRRLVPSAEVEGPLLSTLAPEAARPSSIEELLLRMRIEGESTDTLLAGLAHLARVDVSPTAPPVGPWP